MRNAIMAACLWSLSAAVYPGSAQSADEEGINDIIRSLAPTTQGTGEPIRRPSRVTLSVDGKRVDLDSQYTVDVEVYFDLDSAVLTQKAKRQLEPLGRALESTSLKPCRYMIIGHTDARGSASYNRRLSLMRAEAVRSHLIEVYAVDPGQLDSIGLGEDHLKAEGEPFAAINRRVEITMIAPDEIGQPGRATDGVQIQIPDDGGSLKIIIE